MRNYSNDSTQMFNVPTEAHPNAYMPSNYSNVSYAEQTAFPDSYQVRKYNFLYRFRTHIFQ